MNNLNQSVFDALSKRPMTIDELIKDLDIAMGSAKVAVATLCKNKKIERGALKLNPETGRKASLYRVTNYVYEPVASVIGKQQTWCSPLEWRA